MDPETLKKEVTKIYKRLQSSNLKKRVDALRDLEALVKSDPRALLPLKKIITIILTNGEEEERFMAINVIRAAGMGHVKIAYPFIDALKVNATYNIFDPDLNFYKPGCKIRKNAIFTLYTLAKLDKSILTPDLVDIVISNFTPPIYVSEGERPKDLLDLYTTALLLSILMAKSMPEDVGEHLSSFLHLLNDQNVDIKLQAAIIIEKISRKVPERLKGHISPVMSLLKFPTYRPDTKDEKMVSIYISAMAILDNVAKSHPEWLSDAVTLLSSALRDTYKYERWVSDYEKKGKESFRAIIKNIIEKIAVNKPNLIVPVVVDHLKSVEDLRKYISDLLIKVSEKDPKVTVEAVSKIIMVDNVNAKQAALEILGVIGETYPEVVKPHIPKIARCLDDRYIHVRQKAAYALGLVGRVKPEHVVQFVPQMVPLLSDSYESVRISTIEAFMKIGNVHPKYIVPAIPSLIKLLEDNNRKVREKAAEAIRDLKIDVEEYLTLIKTMQKVNKRIAVAKAKGTNPEAIETRFQEAKREMQEANWVKAHEIIKTIEQELEDLITGSKPALTITIKSNRSLDDSKWEDIIVDIANKGTAHAKDINISFEGVIEVSGTKYVPVLESRSGMEMKMSARMVNKEGGNVKVRVDFNDFDDKEYSFEVSGTYNPGTIFNISSESIPDIKPIEEIGVGDDKESVVTFEPIESVDVEEYEAITTETVPSTVEEDQPPSSEASDTVVDTEGAEDKWREMGIKDIINCPHCNTKIPAESVFCFKCGKKVK